VSQKEGKYATCSDDGTLRVWDLEGKKMLNVVNLDLDQTG